MPPDTAPWISRITDGASARDIADRADIPLRTIQHQLSTGRVTIEAAVRIAAAFDYNPVRALIDLEIIDASWASTPDIPTALEQATTDQLVTAVHQRLTAADALRSQLAMTTTADAGNGVPRANLHAALTRVSDDPERAMAILNAAGLLDKTCQELPDMLEFPAVTAGRQLTGRAGAGQFYLGQQQDGSTGEITNLFWDSSYLLITGGTGTGKTEALRTAAASALLAASAPNVLILSGKGSAREFVDLVPGTTGVEIIVASERDQNVVTAAQAIRAVRRSLEEHQGTLPTRQLILIDEFSDLFGLSPKGGEAKAAAEQALSDLLIIGRDGRNVHVAVTTQNPRTGTLSGDLGAMFTQRLAVGPLMEQDTEAALGQGAERKHPNFTMSAGRGRWRVNGKAPEADCSVQIAYVTDAG